MVRGSLFSYWEERKLSCFEYIAENSPKNVQSTHYLVFIGGMTDGFLSHSWLEDLAYALESIGWTLIHILLSSSYTQFGIHSLSSDCEEIEKFVDWLVGCRQPCEIALLGHSTGCQDIVTYLKNGKNSDKIKCAILQGPASDRDFLRQSPDWQEKLAFAKQMINTGKSQELLPRSWFFVPITAYRYDSLLERHGDDDMFSEDLIHEFKDLYKHMNIPILFVLSLKDQYVPPTVDIPHIAKSMAKATTFGSYLLLPCANHEISHPAAQQTFIEEVKKFLT